MSRDLKDFAEAVMARVGARMFGMDDVVRLSLTALYTGGHVLLEGNPGLGKTELVKTLGDTLSFPSGRIQFTPDLMPADITGSYMPDFKNNLPQNMVFNPGPIFTCLLLADEINRATPKTQAAMLEAMAERQVTVLGKRYRLASPFMVLATQNPIDHEGTYALPEAQADRFMFKIMIPSPGAQTLRRILAKTAGPGASAIENTAASASTALPTDGRASMELYKAFHDRIQSVTPLALVEQHILNIYLATNRKYDELQGLDKDQTKRLQTLVESLTDYGLGPRAPRDLMLGAKAWSILFLPDAEHAEGPALARVLCPTLRHRLKLKFDWEERYAQIAQVPDGADPTQLMDRIINDLAINAAPRAHEYHRIFSSESGPPRGRR